MRYLITITAGTQFNRYSVPLTNEETAAGLLAIRERIARDAGGFTERSSFGAWHNGQDVEQEQGKQWEVLLLPTHGEGSARLLAEAWASFAAQALNQAEVMYTVTPVIAGFAGPK